MPQREGLVVVMADPFSLHPNLTQESRGSLHLDLEGAIFVLSLTVKARRIDIYRKTDRNGVHFCFLSKREVLSQWISADSFATLAREVRARTETLREIANILSLLDPNLIPLRVEDQPPSVVSFSVDDFVIGILAQMALRGRRVLPLDGQKFDAAVQLAYQGLQELAGRHGLDIQFSLPEAIQTDPHSETGPVQRVLAVRMAVSDAAQLGLVTLDFGKQEMRINLTDYEALVRLRQTPGGVRLFGNLTKAVVQFLDNNAAKAE